MKVAIDGEVYDSATECIAIVVNLYEAEDIRDAARERKAITFHPEAADAADVRRAVSPFTSDDSGPQLLK